MLLPLFACLICLLIRLVRLLVSACLTSLSVQVLECPNAAGALTGCSVVWGLWGSGSAFVRNKVAVTE